MLAALDHEAAQESHDERRGFGGGGGRASRGTARRAVHGGAAQSSRGTEEREGAPFSLEPTPTKEVEPAAWRADHREGKKK